MTESGSFAARAARSTVQARDAVVLGWVAPWLETFAGLFESSAPRVRARALEIAAVLGIVAVGAVLRFWGLGAVGLHGDEKTMALPTMHLVHYGTPLFPSGLHYVRGIGQLYLMAAAIEAFGQSAWSFRLPSALCGILLIALAYLAGRRYLSTAWNLAFTVTVACLPSFIEDAQTARMYVFLVTCVAGYLVLLFEWERTGRDAWLAAAAIVLVIGIQFHQLAIFAAFLVFYPGLLRSDARRLLAGLAAFVVVTISFFLISHWIALSYPPTVTLPGTPEAVPGPQAAALVTHPGLAWLAVLAVILAALGASLARALPRGSLGVAAAAFLALVPLAQLLDAYHVACILAVTGAVMASRSLSAHAASASLPRAADRGGPGRGAVTASSATRFVSRLVLLGLICAAILAVQLFELAHAGVPVRERVGLLLGWPSVWPFFAIAQYSRIAALAVAAGVAVALARLARRRTIPDFVLLLALGVWIPLLMIGLFKWDIPPRYAAAQVFPLLLGGFAAAQWLWRSAARRAGAPAPQRSGRKSPAPDQRSSPRTARWQAALAALFAIFAVGPVSFARAVGSGYGDHPDHLGAARFILSRHLGPKDIVIAEDVIVQTYYLGHVDYWLIGKATASKDFVYRHDGRYEDIYTNAPLITSASELERLIARPDRGAIYIIGSGEQQADGRAYARGPSLEHFFRTSPLLHVLFVGRDGLTKIWMIPAPAGKAAPRRAAAPAQARAPAGTRTRRAAAQSS